MGSGSSSQRAGATATDNPILQRYRQSRELAKSLKQRREAASGKRAEAGTEAGAGAGVKVGAGAGAGADEEDAAGRQVIGGLVPTSIIAQYHRTLEDVPAKAGLLGGEVKKGWLEPFGETAEAIRSSDVPPRHASAPPEASLKPRRIGQLLWYRNQVIQSVRKRHRLSKEEKLARTERTVTLRSHWFKTSTKKLGMLARQIAGRPLEEAVVQMGFSPKGPAQEVGDHLRYARNVAMLRRGMGQGAADDDMKGAPVQIQTKEGKRKAIDDQTGIYISQAYVNRGPYRKALEYRARGRINVLRKPYTSISLVLKENKTLIREAAEREAKKRRRKVWVQLPDRPIIYQHQFYCW